MSTKELSIIESLNQCVITPELLQTSDFSEKYGALLDFMEKAEVIKATIDGSIKDIVQDNYYKTGESSIQTNGYRFTYSPPSTRETFDSKKFKSEHGDMYKQYVKVGQVSGSMRVYKIKKPETKEEVIDAVN